METPCALRPPPTCRHHDTQAGRKPPKIPQWPRSPQVPFLGTLSVRGAGENSRDSAHSSLKSLPSTEVSVLRDRSLKQGIHLPTSLSPRLPQRGKQGASHRLVPLSPGPTS